MRRVSVCGGCQFAEGVKAWRVPESEQKLRHNQVAAIPGGEYSAALVRPEARERRRRESEIVHRDSD